MIIDYKKCPNPNMKQSVQLYVERGIKPGSFLSAVLANDFAKATCQADDINGKLLREWAIFILNEIPVDCWGSWDKVRKWKGLQ